MSERLPPMHALRAFEVLSRLRHFNRTAEALHLSPSAVSHQIRALESFYAAKLFERSRRDVALTRAGEQLLEAVQGALQQLSTAGDAIRERDPDRLSLTLPPSLASRWLMPRLGGFLERHPTIDFHLHATLALVDLDAQQIDFGIRYGGGRWRGLRSTRLFNEEIFPVASPAYLARVGVRRLADIGRGTLLRDDFKSWEEWHRELGLTMTSCACGPVFNDSALLLQAAEAGRGIALARSLLAKDALASGALRRVGSRALTAAGSYYLVAPARRAETAMARVFRDWLVDLAKG